MAVLCLEQIPIDPQSSDPSQSDKQDVLCLCFSPSEETLMASTSKNQLYTITMSLTEISKVSPFQSTWIEFHAKLSMVCERTIHTSKEKKLSVQKHSQQSGWDGAVPP